MKFPQHRTSITNREWISKYPKQQIKTQVALPMIFSEVCKRLRQMVLFDYIRPGLTHMNPGWTGVFILFISPSFACTTPKCNGLLLLRLFKLFSLSWVGCLDATVGLYENNARWGGENFTFQEGRKLNRSTNQDLPKPAKPTRRS